MPAVSNKNASDSRIASSSSMMWMTASSGISLFLLRGGAQRQMENRPATGIGLHPEVATMRFHDGARYRQADTHAMPLGRDEGLEQLFGDFRRDAGTRIGDARAHEIAVKRPGRNGNLAARRPSLDHRLDGVSH